MRYKLTIAYDGTHYCGWQTQENGLSIQTLIQQALQCILRHSLDLTGAGRTDAGVHARGQVAHFDSDIPFNSSRLRISLNALLPPDIRIFAIDSVAPDFHARYSALAKIYTYYLHLDPVTDPFTKLYRTQVFGPFNRKAVEQAIPHFLGTHDFASFANTKEPAQTDTIRTLSRLEMIDEKGGVRLEFEGDGFLYKMVRNITGTLLDIAAGKISSDAIPSILAAKDRRSAGTAAPPQGLFLTHIRY